MSIVFVAGFYGATLSPYLYLQFPLAAGCDWNVSTGSGALTLQETNGKMPAQQEVVTTQRHQITPSPYF